VAQVARCVNGRNRKIIFSESQPKAVSAAHRTDAVRQRETRSVHLSIVRCHIKCVHPVFYWNMACVTPTVLILHLTHTSRP
jgi:hypothetical protein